MRFERRIKPSRRPTQGQAVMTNSTEFLVVARLFEVNSYSSTRMSGSTERARKREREYGVISR